MLTDYHRMFGPERSIDYALHSRDMVSKHPEAARACQIDVSQHCINAIACSHRPRACIVLNADGCRMCLAMQAEIRRVLENMDAGFQS